MGDARNVVTMSVDAPPDDIDHGVPWHFGDPLREQRWLAEGAAAVDLSHLPILRVTGDDRRSWLHDLTTQHVTDLHGSALGLVLSPHGHVEHELHMIDDGTATWIIAQPGTAEELVAYLRSMQFMLRVDVADVSDDFAVVFEPVGDADPSVPTWIIPAEFQQQGATEAGSDRGGDARRYAVAALEPLRGREVIVPRTALADRLANWPERAGTWAWQAARVASGMPRLHFETDHRTLPHEVGWVGPGVHLAKGCYRGQEAVARVHNLGQPPRRIVLLHLDGSVDVLPQHGDPVFDGERQVGWIGSAVHHYEWGPIGTAIVKRSVPLDAQLTVHSGDDHISARQHT
jgi:folate-binding protein YgfZ